MVNVLFVSISFPPKSDAECLQTAKYFHYLQHDTELQIEVVTSHVPTLYMNYDVKLEPYAEGYINQVAVKLKENRWVNLLRNRLKLEESVFPDAKQSFHQQSEKVIERIKQKPDLIYSRSYPLSSAIMAYKLKQHYKVPWILHLSDPWADAPLHNWSAAYNAKQREWELKCMEAAQFICLTSLPTIEFYCKKYPHLREKFLFFPNVYELKQPPEENFPHLEQLLSSKKLNIVFTGAMAGERSPSYFLEPLSELLTVKPEVSSKVNIIFAGEADYRNRAVFEKYKMSLVHYLGKVSFTEAQYLQRQARLLLVIDNPIAKPEMAMFFPSKLLDYMVAKKRVLAITTKGSATDLVMQDLKGDVFGHANKEQIMEAIEQAIAEFEKGNDAYFQSEKVPEKYEAKYNAGRLAELIKKIVNA